MFRPALDSLSVVLISGSELANVWAVDQTSIRHRLPNQPVNTDYFYRPRRDGRL